MDKFIEEIKAFIEKVKSDPSLSDLFRDAAQELHDALNPKQDTTGEQQEPPAPVTEQAAPPTGEPAPEQTPQEAPAPQDG